MWRHELNVLHIMSRVNVVRKAHCRGHTIVVLLGPRALRDTLIPCIVEAMIQSFADAATNDLYYGKASKAARRFPADLATVIRRKLDYVHAATTLLDLAAPPGNRLHALKGDQQGRHAIRVNDQYRITFRFADGSAHEVRCEDYH